MQSQSTVQLERRIADLERLVKQLLAPKSKARIIAGVSGGGDALIAVTRSGGIAAMTSTSAPYTWTSAVCDLIDPDTGDLYDPNQTKTIYNMAPVAIAGEILIQAKKHGATKYFVDVDTCPATEGGSS